MKLAVVTYGTEGDTRPLAALCRALLDAGHEVVLLADHGTLGGARAWGVPHAALSGDIRAALQPNDGVASIVAAKHNLNATAKALAHIANTHTEAWMRETREAAAGCDAMIVSGLAAFAGLSVAECLGIEAIGAGLIPISPTAAFPSPFLPGRAIPSWLNRASHRLVNALLWRAFAKSTNAARATVCGLPPRRKVWTDHPMLYGVSPSLLPQPCDWPAHTRICGQWTIPVRDWTAPPALSDFLAAGEPPLYIGFGSMAGFDRPTLLHALVTATAGRRALFYPGWSGAAPVDLPRNFMVIGDTPHDWLFPRTALVVHHGGSGTSHSAARAGVPSIVLPFAGDQFFWAERLRRAGVAPAGLTGRNVNANALAIAIDTAQTSPLRNRAIELGASMREEDGLSVAVKAVEARLARKTA